MTTIPKEELRLYHPNVRDCSQAVRRGNVNNWSDGREYLDGRIFYECPGHRVTVEEARRFIVKEVANE